VDVDEEFDWTEREVLAVAISSEKRMAASI
jgi:hypothetical protein